MDHRPWWVRWSPRTRFRIWRWRRSDEYKQAVAGYVSGRVCRFCDRSSMDAPWCDIPNAPGLSGRPCDFRTGKLRVRRRWT